MYWYSDTGNFSSFHVRFCQATFVTFFQFSYIRSIIPLTHVTIGVVCCQNQNLVEYSVFVLQKTFSCISHRQRVSHRSQPSIDRERSRHSPIICHMRKTCEFEVSVLRCRMQSATRSFVELPLCSKISSLVLLKIRGEFLNLFCGIVQRPGSGTSRFTTSLCCNCFVYDSAFNSFVFNHISP